MLDTHAAFKRLTAAGMAEPQAEAIVTTLDTITARLDTFATKADLTTEIARLEARFTNRIYAGIATLLVLSKALDFLIGP